MTSPKQVVRDFFTTFSTGDVDNILACLTDDAAWWVAGSIPQISGESSKSAFANVLRFAVTLYRGKALRITPSSMISEGNSVAVEADGFAELNDGSVYRNKYHFLIQVNGDRIQAVKEYSDTQQMLTTFSRYLSKG